ncbi:MAG: prenyltransferase [Pyrinomonadaceae bacterium]
MPDLRFLLKVSRPRFWFYVFGPYILGLVAAATTRSDLLDWRTVLFAIYFLFPANLLIYGVNDIFDYETDRLNEKKAGYELLVDRRRHKGLTFWILLVNLPFLIAAAVFVPVASISLAGFLFFSIFYSAPPIRAKTIPFLDSAFNILYIFPGAFGYQLIYGSFPPVILMVAASLWTAAMHAYSAIPDIEADKEAGLKTIATVCGPYLTLAICGFLYLAAAIVSADYLGFISLSLGGVYVILMLASARSVKTGRLFKLYRAFPFINVLAGFIIFWQIALDKML